MEEWILRDIVFLVRLPITRPEELHNALAPHLNQRLLLFVCGRSGILETPTVRGELRATPNGKELEAMLRSPSGLLRVEGEDHLAAARKALSDGTVKARFAITDLEVPFLAIQYKEGGLREQPRPSSTTSTDRSG